MSWRRKVLKTTWEMGRKAEGKVIPAGRSCYQSVNTTTTRWGAAKRGEENQRNKGMEAGQREKEAPLLVMPIIHEGFDRLISLRGGLPPKYHSMPETMLSFHYEI